MHETISDGVVVTSIFWATANVIQRIYARVVLNTGCFGPIKLIAGLVSATASISLANYFHQKGIKKILLSKKYDLQSIATYAKSSKVECNMKEILKATMAGLLLFAVLEQRSFATMLPSSILVKGAYAQGFFMNKFSIPSTSAVATSSQRLTIQKLGKAIGCHHCGSRQIFSKGSFIADHMPPTKFANMMNGKWWRRLFNIMVCFLFLI